MKPWEPQERELQPWEEPGGNSTGTLEDRPVVSNGEKPVGEVALLRQGDFDDDD